ncbi:hypothetical protein [Haladaptatus sp. CMAA 1911]|uniref:DUF6414 family protein n=1 Tax=unclassified Haladaptatus TaxID=2622732 RepID=UPI00375423C8
MGVIQIIYRLLIYLIRIPFRVIDWVKVKLGYVSVPPLREFVYLDETSVVSLIASTTGGVTEQKSTVKRRQISGSIKGGLGGKNPLLNGNIGGTRERSSEAVRRYVIQSNFKELYEMRAEDMVIADEYDPKLSIPKRIWNRILGKSNERTFDSEVDFVRGSLAEVNINLGSHEVYDFYTAMASIAEMFDTFPKIEELEGNIEDQELSLEKLEAFSDLIEHLMAGLVPIVGEVVDYGVLVRDESAEIVSKEYAEENNIELDRLNIVGFVDSDKFWQEETRFLFDDDEYTVYCRLDSEEVSDDWMPIKLIAVVDSILSGTGESLEDIPDMFEKDENDTVISNKTDLDLRSRLEDYLEVLETEANLEIESGTAEEVLEITLQDVGGTTQRLEGVEESIERLEKELESKNIDYNLSDDTRADTIDNLLSRDFDTITKHEKRDWYLEVSFTAIYW